MPDQNHLSRLAPELKILLDAELAAGNQIKETNVDFPRTGAHLRYKERSTDGEDYAD